MALSGKEGQTFVLLRYVLIIAAAYLFLFEGKAAPPAILPVFIAMALLSNLFLGRVSEDLLLRPLVLGIILCADIAWIAAGLWYNGNFGSDIFFLYFFVLFLAAIGQNVILITCVSLVLAGMDVVLFVPVSGDNSIWTSPALIRIPFMFVAALFYGHLTAKVREEKESAEKRIRALHEIDRAMTSTLDLRGMLEILLEKIDLFLPYSVATVRLLNKRTGELEPAACRNLDEEEWKAAMTRAGGPERAISENNSPMVRSDPTDPRVPSEFLRKHGLVSYRQVPLIAKEEVLGTLTFFTKEEHEFSSKEVEFLSALAGRAAIAIHNSRLYEEIVTANRVKDEFLSVISHELRTPLNVITGYTGLLREKMYGELNPKQEQALGKIIERSNDLLAMINSILYVTSIEAQAIRAERRKVDLTDFLNELKSSYDATTYKELTLQWECDPRLPMVKTDSAKLKHVLENIINNAIKFTQKGQVTISTRYLAAAKCVEFKVTDTGIGIPSESLPIIFERFRQIDSSNTRRYGGVGIGLYVVKKFTELLGGKIEVQSEPGKGSTFSVTLPCEN